MLNLILTTLFLGNLQVTSYRPVRSQTDDSPTWTSIGDRTTMYGCAVSRDYLTDGTIKYGDILYVDGYGFRVVNDCMGPRAKHSIDLLVRTWEEEHKIGVKHKNVWIVRRSLNEKEAGYHSKTIRQKSFE